MTTPKTNKNNDNHLMFIIKYNIYNHNSNTDSQSTNLSWRSQHTAVESRIQAPFDSNPDIGQDLDTEYPVVGNREKGE